MQNNKAKQNQPQSSGGSGACKSREPDQITADDIKEEMTVVDDVTGTFIEVFAEYLNI